MEDFRWRVISALNMTSQSIELNRAWNTWTDSAIVRLFRRSFSSKELGTFPFEFSIDVDARHRASAGFTLPPRENQSHLVLHNLLMPPGKFETTNEQITLVVPFWKRYVWKDMVWIIVASVLLTIMLLVIFCYASFPGEPDQQLLYDKRSTVLQNMIQQLEVPLSTVSVAAEALRNARVMNDYGKINYYQQIINEENKRMNEQVEQFLRELIAESS